MLADLSTGMERFYILFSLIYLFLNTLLSLSGNSGHLTWVRLQQAQEQRDPVLRVLARSVGVFVIDHWTVSALHGNKKGSRAHTLRASALFE